LLDQQYGHGHGHGNPNLSDDRHGSSDWVCVPTNQEADTVELLLAPSAYEPAHHQGHVSCVDVERIFVRLHAKANLCADVEAQPSPPPPRRVCACVRV
jgi:hypothetical protein